MLNKIKVLIVDDITTREQIVNFLKSDHDIMITGQATSAVEAIQQVKMLKPDIIFLSTSLPDMDGFTATKSLLSEVPFSGVILTGTQVGPEDMRRAMIAGAKDYIVKPFVAEDLLQSVKQIHANSEKRRSETTELNQGEIVTIFSTKGGVGKTIMAVNLALALANKYERKVAILDFDLQFGDVAICLDVLPKASIADLITDVEHLDEDVMSRYMVSYNAHLDILPAPFQPEMAEKITSHDLSIILNLLKKHYQYIIVDTASAFDDKTLTAMDSSDLVFVISVPDLTTTKNVKLSLDTLETLGYSKDKIKLVMNRYNSKGALNINEMEDSLHRKFSVVLPNDSEVVLSSVNKGIPFIIGSPDSPISRAITDLAGKIINNELKDSEENVGNKTADKGVFGKLKRLFGKKD